MCGGGAPDPPKPTREQVAAEKEAAALRQAELQRQRDERANNKKFRFEMALRRIGMGFGRGSLLTGGKGGAGFNVPIARSLLTTGG